MNEALFYDSSLEEFRAVCQKVTGFYFVERYPLIVESGLTPDDVSNAVQQVAALVEKLRAAVPAANSRNSQSASSPANSDG